MVFLEVVSHVEGLEFITGKQACEGSIVLYLIKITIYPFHFFGSEVVPTRMGSSVVLLMYVTIFCENTVL